MISILFTERQYNLNSNHHFMNPSKKTVNHPEYTRQPSRKNILNHNQKTIHHPLSTKKTTKKGLSKKNEKTFSDIFIVDDRTKTKIPQLINELEKNVKQLRKYCINVGDNVPKKKKSLTTIRSQTKLGNQHSKSGLNQQIQDIRKSYVSTFGKDTSNFVELINFYKKGIEKSTGILGSISKKAQSMSMSRNHNQFFSREESLLKSKNPSTITQNQENIPHLLIKPCKVQNYEISECENYENLYKKQTMIKREIIQNTNNQNNQNFYNIPESQHHKFAQTISVAHILSEKRKSLQQKCKITNAIDFQYFHKQMKSSRSNKKQIEKNQLGQVQQAIQPNNNLDQAETNQKQLKSEKRKNILSKFTFINSPFDIPMDKKGKTPEKNIKKEEQLIGSKQKSNKTLKSKNKQTNTHSNNKISNKNSVSPDKQSSRKLELLDQAQIFEETYKEQIKPTKKSQKSFENSKYYVKPIKKFNQDANNSLFDCSISIRDDGLNCKNVDLDFIPLDL